MLDNQRYKHPLRIYIISFFSTESSIAGTPTCVACQVFYEDAEAETNAYFLH